MTGTNAEKVRELYKRSGLTYDELSAVTGINRNTLAQWISLKKSPPDYVVELIRIKLNEYKDAQRVIERIKEHKVEQAVVTES